VIYRRFGKTELQMPLVTCGCMRFQHAWKDCPLDEIPPESQANVEACVRRALELGVTHIETARGYGTSERQLGVILPTLPRDEMIVQTKLAPTEDPATFLGWFDESMDRLQLDYVDMLSLHGVNNREVLDWSVRPGGCLAAARKLQAEGKCRHVGFSTHAAPDVVLEAVKTDAEGGFDYVNLHWFYIYQPNWQSIEEATRRDMGVFIISPNDKGGKLYDPPERLCELTAPLHPMVFNDAYCMLQEKIHTLSMGVAKPDEFDAHIEAVELLESGKAEETIAPIAERLETTMAEAVPAEILDPYNAGLPAWEDTPGGVNIPVILWLRNLAVAYGMVGYGRMRYNLLGSGGHFFPGYRADKLDELDLAEVLAGHPLAEQIPSLLAEADELLNDEPRQRLSDTES